MAVAASAKKTAKKTTKRTAKKATKSTAASSTTNGHKGGPKLMTAEHKKALAIGREESSAVRAYLDALETHRPKRGRKVTAESLRARIMDVAQQIMEAPLSKRLRLVQERMDLQERLANLDTEFDMTTLEMNFKKHAKGFAQRNGISHAAFRELGVSPQLLKDAGITRS